MEPVTATVARPVSPSAEQLDRWQQAINLLDYLDFHALTEEGLAEAGRRFAKSGVPGWAIELRRLLIALGKDELWPPQFALRSETALCGLQVFHVGNSARGSVYRRVALRFFYEALKPFEAWAAAAPEDEELHQRGKEVISRVRDLCHIEGPLLELDLSRATQGLKRAPLAGLAGIVQPSRILSSSRNRPPIEIDPDPATALELLVSGMLREWNQLLLRPSEGDSWWLNSRKQSVMNLFSRLNGLHNLRENRVGKLYAELIAQAYLAALEHECPPPDWMLPI